MKTAETILAEFPSQVIASHALVVTQILGGEEVEPETFVHLAAEVWTIAKLARLLTLHANYINEARQCWREAVQAFDACAQQWARLSKDGSKPVETHRRLLEQLCIQAVDELELYSLTYSDRLRERH